MSDYFGATGTNGTTGADGAFVNGTNQSIVNGEADLGMDEISVRIVAVYIFMSCMLTNAVNSVVVNVTWSQGHTYLDCFRLSELFMISLGGFLYGGIYLWPCWVAFRKGFLYCRAGFVHNY